MTDLATITDIATVTDLPGGRAFGTPVSELYGMLYTGAMIVLGIVLLACLVRAIIGPRIADRVIAINMMGTAVIIIIGILCFMMNEGYLADVAIIYAMLSFLAVVLLSKIYMGSYREKRHNEKEGKHDA